HGGLHRRLTGRIAIAGGAIEEECRTDGPVDSEGRIFRADAAAFRMSKKFCMEFNSNLMFFDRQAGIVIDRESFAIEREAIGGERLRLEWLRAGPVEVRSKRELARLAGSEANSNHLI